MKCFSLFKKNEIHLETEKKIIPGNQITQLLDALEVLKIANRDAIDLMEETKKECEELKKKAQEEGFGKGLIEFNKHILALDKQVKNLRLEVQKMVLPLALKAAKKIVGEELKMYPEHILDIVMGTLKPVLQCRHVKILVNKKDVKILEQEKPQIKEKLDHVELLSIEERPDIEQGSCIIETEAGIINATLENQWRAIEAAFESYLKL